MFIKKTLKNLLLRGQKQTFWLFIGKHLTLNNLHKIAPHTTHPADRVNTAPGHEGSIRNALVKTFL